jgi:hypothetical protein
MLGGRFSRDIDRCAALRFDLGAVQKSWYAAGRAERPPRPAALEAIEAEALGTGGLRDVVGFKALISRYRSSRGVRP